MDRWFLSAVLALLIYGLWGFFPKLAVTYISPRSALVYEVAGAVLVGIFALWLEDFRPDTHPRGVLFAVLTGAAGMLGTLFYFTAASTGRISVVVAVTALYPVVTILLAALFLQEPFTLKHLAGMGLALAAIVLLSV